MDKADMLFPGGCLNKEDEQAVMDIQCGDTLEKEEIMNTLKLNSMES